MLYILIIKNSISTLIASTFANISSANVPNASLSESAQDKREGFEEDERKIVRHASETAQQKEEWLSRRRARDRARRGATPTDISELRLAKQMSCICLVYSS